MVDINLIGDDKTGEEERVEEFTQTSSMDTQELAFEERTETFDTTKTAGFSQKRNYSSLIATLIIMAVIVLLGSAIYFFMFSDNADEPADLAFQPQDDGALEQTASEEELGAFDDGALQADLADFRQADPVEDQPVQQQVEQPFIEDAQPVQQPTVQRAAPRPDISPVRSSGPAPDFVASSRDAIQAVTSLIAMVPGELSTTLLSYTSQRVRLEFASSTASVARDFAGRLNQTWGAGSFKVVSETQVGSNGGFLDKVLIAGRISSTAPANGGAQELSLAQIKDWVGATARQFGLSVRELKTQPSTFGGGGQATPLLARLYGNQGAISDFLQEMGKQSLNVELVKILLVSPDMVNYTDDNLILVMNMLLHE